MALIGESVMRESIAHEPRLVSNGTNVFI